MSNFIKLHCIGRRGRKEIRYANIKYIAEVVDITDFVETDFVGDSYKGVKCSVFYSNGNNILATESAEEVLKMIEIADGERDSIHSN